MAIGLAGVSMIFWSGNLRANRANNGAADD